MERRRSEVGQLVQELGLPVCQLLASDDVHVARAAQRVDAGVFDAVIWELEGYRNRHVKEVERECRTRTKLQMRLNIQCEIRVQRPGLFLVCRVLGDVGDVPFTQIVGILREKKFRIVAGVGLIIMVQERKPDSA